MIDLEKRQSVDEGEDHMADAKAGCANEKPQNDRSERDGRPHNRGGPPEP